MYHLHMQVKINSNGRASLISEVEEMTVAYERYGVVVILSNTLHKYWQLYVAVTVS